MNTGENEQALRKILDMTRAISIALLLLHFYFYDYAAFSQKGLRSDLTDRILTNLVRTGLFNQFHTSKLLALAMLLVSLVGARGRKDEKITYRAPTRYLAIGIVLFFGSYFLWRLPVSYSTRAVLYIGATLPGFILILTGGTLASRILRTPSNKDPFNRYNESFPQEERLLTNPYSINIPATYVLKGEVRQSWINIVNPFRGLLLMGSPGSGKTWYIVQSIIKQQIQKGFSMLVYDFKYDDLSRIAYNYFERYRHVYPGSPAFYNINFDDLDRSHRCNPLDASTMTDISDAGEAARTILIGLNKDGMEKQGEFFLESSITFVTALIWYLRQYQGGKYCTWAHVIELAQVPYQKLFSILQTEPQVSSYIGSFVKAFIQASNDQLQGQIDTAVIMIARLSSPSLYYILTGDDFTLDLNNPQFPKIVCLGNNPQKTSVYGALISVYVNTITRLTNRKGMIPLAFNLDEFSTIVANSIDKTIATGRSNKIAITIALQDASQLKLAYGKEYAEVIMNTCGNIISGQVTGESAKQVSDRIGKTMQDRESRTITSQDTNFTRSRQLEVAVPVSRMATLSSGEFAGIIADNPDQEITLKAFCSKAQNDPAALEKEAKGYEDLPRVRRVTRTEVMDNYLQKKQDVVTLVEAEIDRMMNDPDLEHLVIKKQ